MKEDARKTLISLSASLKKKKKRNELKDTVKLRVEKRANPVEGQLVALH